MAFVNATIECIAEGVWKLTIYYSYYNLYNYTDIHCFKTLEECKDKLLEVRCYGRLSIIKSE